MTETQSQSCLEHTEMCLSSLPGLARTRHWSCPEKLPSLCTEELLLPARSREAGDLPRTPGLALWEEKVLSLRGSRSNKHRELLKERRQSRVEEPIKELHNETEYWHQKKETNAEGVEVAVEQLQERLLRAFLGEEESVEGDHPQVHGEAGYSLLQEQCAGPGDCLAQDWTGRQQLTEDWTESPRLPEDWTESPEIPGDWTETPRLPEDWTDTPELPQNWDCSPLSGPGMAGEEPACLPEPSLTQHWKPQDPGIATCERGLSETRPAHCEGPALPSPSCSRGDLSPPLPCPPTSQSDLLHSKPQQQGAIKSSYSSVTALVSWLLLAAAFSPPCWPRRARTSGGRGRGRSTGRARPRRPPWLLLAASCLLLHTPPALAQLQLEDMEDKGPLCVDGVFRGNIDINNRDESSKMSSLAKYVNCSVVEGSISITAAVYPTTVNQDINYSMPNLIEVTDFVLLYRADEITSFKDIFPRLAVIRGHKLVQFYALAIFQNAKMRDVGLPSLTHIMNGGVRIEKNPALCYVDRVDWKMIVQQKDDHKNIYLNDNQEKNVCPAKCDEKCSGTQNLCWNGGQCQRMLGICPEGTAFKGERDRCYVDTQGQVGQPCATNCIGGCTRPNNSSACYACNHTRHITDSSRPGAFTCLDACPRGYVAYKQWTCIKESECSNRTISSTPWHTFPRDGDNNYKVEGNQCVVKCNPKNKAVKGDDGIWRCKPCQDKCPVICSGTLVNSPSTAKKLASCTDVTGDIVISVISAEITSILETNLQHIETIQGTLKIERSHSLVSLHFFKSLREIRGDVMGGMGGGGDQKVLTIFENDNLQKLFPENNKVRLGGNDNDGNYVSPVVFIHYNQKLCKKEINQFLDNSDVDSDFRRDHMVSPYSNGNKIVCSEEKLKIQVNPGGPIMLRVNYQNYQHRLETSNSNLDINALLGYHVYYRELTDQQFEEQNMSKFDGMDVCGGSRWQIIFKEHTSENTNTITDIVGRDCDETTERCMRDERGNLWAIITYPEITTYIVNCKPYTAYAVYVTTVMEKSLAANATGAQSDIIYTRTLEMKPTPVLDLKSTSETEGNSTSLEVEWKPPRDPNGPIDQYYVMITYEQSREVTDRDYCSDQEKVDITGKQDEEVNAKAKEEFESPEEGTCPACPTCDGGTMADKPGPRPKAPDSDQVASSMAFYNEIINKLFQIQSTASIEDGSEALASMQISQRRRRDVSSGSAKNSVSTTEQPEQNSQQVVLVQQNGQNPDSRPRSLSIDTEMMEVAGMEYINRTFLAVSGNVTKASIKGLIHYGDYEVRVFACQQQQTYSESDGIEMEVRVCSDETILNTRTKHRDGMDDIPFYNPSGMALNTDTNNSVLVLQWRRPESPNGMVLYYQLDWSISMDGPWSGRCLSLNKITQLKDGVMEYALETPGEYYVRLRAVSLYDEGHWTVMQWVKVASDKSGTIITAIVLAAIALIAAMAGAYGFVHYRKQKENHSAWAYSTRNPDYVDTGDVYVVDDWECERDNVEMGAELGKGSFGMVYKGYFKDPKQGGAMVHCAVKTVNEQAGLKQRIEFLREASAMKDCNTEHVIKLIGVVSQSQPVLVLMELMENGDLKEYLRKHRPDDQNNRDGHLAVPTLSQVLQMAADIADGMAYLGNKKIVHRDLAARNCMLSADTVVKVGDFGMARDVYETEYYRKEGRGFLPVRWMAPESIRDGKFTSQSDVWSYGVVLWEMATLAEVPYQGLANEQVMSYVKEGQKMRRPENCHDVLYEMMSECWEAQPNDRPTFLDLCKRLLPDASEGFTRSAFFLSSDGQDAVLNQEQMQQMRREQEEAQHSDPQTPLTAQTNGSNGLSTENNGHLPASGDSLAMVTIRPGTSRSPTHVQFSNEQSSQQPSGSRTSKLSMNGIISEISRLRNKSGSTSGEA